MRQALILPQALYEEMLTHLLGVYPEEGCGLLPGRDHHILAHYPIENKLHSPTAYEMNPKQQIKAMLAFKAEGLELVSMYHSHPHGPAEPSETDKAYAYYPEAIQIIVSLAEVSAPVVRAFVVEPGRDTIEVPLVIQ